MITIYDEVPVLLIRIAIIIVSVIATVSVVVVWGSFRDYCTYNVKNTIRSAQICLKERRAIKSGPFVRNINGEATTNRPDD